MMTLKWPVSSLIVIDMGQARKLRVPPRQNRVFDANDDHDHDHGFPARVSASSKHRKPAQVNTAPILLLFD